MVSVGPLAVLAITSRIVWPSNEVCAREGAAQVAVTSTDNGCATMLFDPGQIRLHFNLIGAWAGPSVARPPFGITAP